MIANSGAITLSQGVRVEDNTSGGTEVPVTFLARACERQRSPTCTLRIFYGVGSGGAIHVVSGSIVADNVSFRGNTAAGTSAQPFVWKECPSE